MKLNGILCFRTRICRSDTILSQMMERNGSSPVDEIFYAVDVVMLHVGMLGVLTIKAVFRLILGNFCEKLYVASF